jgi:5,10-methylenetetrahydromethanopterin reductase
MKTRVFYCRAYPYPDEVENVAREVEADGWDGLLFVDSQNLIYDVFASLYLAASVTTRIRLGTAVTNLETRHPAVVASAFATLQHVTGGRAHLGVGRGDTAVELIGQRPPSTRQFEKSLGQLQSYLRGESLDVDGVSSRIVWLPEKGMAKVPVNVFASGPRMIAGIAPRVELLTLAVGADPGRVQWGIEIARRARREAGLDPEGLSIGAFVVTGAGSDPDALRELVRGNVSVSAHFQRGSMPHLDDLDRRVVAAVTRDYQKSRHGLRRSPQARRIPDDFATRFTVVGTVEHCIKRLAELLSLGLDHLVLVGPTREMGPNVRQEWAHVLATEVLPELR